MSARPFVLVPQFPLSYREVAQAWRRLRRPIRQGPRTELDVDATIAQRSRLGVASPIVLRAPRRNIARLLLLVDWQGSMTPFHRFCDEVIAAIQGAARLDDVRIYYFHDTPAEGADPSVLGDLADELFPVLDPILPAIEPLEQGYLYVDRKLLSLEPLAKVLKSHADNASVVVLSDAGAARGSYDTQRLLDTLSFAKALRPRTKQYLWLNPLPRRYWAETTAGQLQRHVPMFPLDRDGLDQAVNVLRGQPYHLEQPL